MPAPVRVSLAAVFLPAFLLGAATTEAALAPPYDRLVQFRAVLDTAGLVDALNPDGLIEKVERAGDLTYRVWSSGCFVEVRLTPIPPAGGMVGPTRYEGRTSASTCR